ncbi:hypothetical protein [Desulfuromonas sp.]|uniref:TlpA family protein disulfide reductase n=1 Tax=Desulfuromonas sp. TaxID=892 RepID=UPI0025BF351B|nr:hypothetical protein [Desulfuromonas sp.]
MEKIPTCRFRKGLQPSRKKGDGALRVVGALLFLTLAISAAPAFSEAQTVAPAKVTLHFFWAESCPHCAEQRPFLEGLQERYPRLEVLDYEIWNNRANFDLLVSLAESFGQEAVSTPATAIDGRLWFGFSDPVASEIEEVLQRCLSSGCTDPLERPAAPGAGQPEEPAVAGESPPIAVPGLGLVDPSTLSLPAFTFVLGLLDGFNPCAFFVLLFLLSLLIHARSRRLMLLVGGTFVLFSGLIYFLFMAAWLNLFFLAGTVRAITAVAGGVALVIAAINVKDYFSPHRWLSLSIPEGAKPRLFARMRGLVQASRIPSVLFGTVVLAVSANSYELLCTAGFPMVYTRVLSLHEMPRGHYYAYLALYNLVYVLPLLVIVLAFTATLGSRKLSEKEGRGLKLVSGLMMLCLGLILLVRPDLLNSAWTAIVLLLLALGTAGIILLLERLRNGGRGPL